MEKYRIVKLEQTCGACPSQWDACTDDGIGIYIRYRWGYLSAYVWETKEYLYGEQIGDGLDGYLTTRGMIRRLSDILEFDL